MVLTLLDLVHHAVRVSINFVDDLSIEHPLVNLASGNVTSSSGPDVIVPNTVTDVDTYTSSM